MKDVELIDTLATRIDEALANYGLAGVPVIKKQQPTQQGIPTGNQIWFELLFSIPFGWSMKSASFENDTTTYINGIFKEKEDQIYQTRFQISGLFPETPGNTDLPTANDVLTHISRFLTHRATIRKWFKEHQISLYRVDMNNNQYKMFDDQSQFEAFPSFDIVILHRNALEITVPAVIRAEGDTHPV